MLTTRRCGTAQCAATRHSSAHVCVVKRRAERTAGVLCRYIIFISRQGGYDMARQRARASGDTARDALRHGTQCAACAWPERGVGTAWARHAHGLGATCSQPRFRVYTLFTQPSFDLVHCLQSLFETLFTDTVHEHCSRTLFMNTLHGHCS